MTKTSWGLSGNQLKLIALIAMTLDHIGVYLLPQHQILRIIGRLALPVYAFLIAEGCHYTRNKLKYLGLMATLALGCQLVYFFVMKSLYMCILVTFSLSIFKMLNNALIFAMLGFKRNIAAVFGMVLFCMLCYALLLIYVPLGLLTPILLIFGSCGFMATYAAFPKIKAVMIDPYYTEPEEEDDDFEPVFRDMG